MTQFCKAGTADYEMRIFQYTLVNENLITATYGTASNFKYNESFTLV